MNTFRRACFAFAAAPIVLGACDRSKQQIAVDSATLKPTVVADSSTAATVRSWNPDIGHVLLVSATSPSEAFVLLPGDSAARAAFDAIPRPASATLFSRAGNVQLAEVPTVTDSGACAVATIASAPPPHPWSVGFIGGVVAPVPVDSTESFNHADSLTAVTWMNRLASAIPNDTAGRFSGLPFVVRGLWRFNLADGTQILLANVTRQLNQEAMPLQEHTFIIAERAANDTSFKTAYSERSYGEEETIANHDVLAATQLGTNKEPAVIVARDFGDATAYALIERVSPGRWRAGWSSPRRHC